jgi:kinesin family protein 5
MDIGIARPTPASSSQAQERSQSNIQVVCRFRPAREKDPFEWYKAIEEQGAVQVDTPERALDFGFDRVFDSQATQGDVYDSVRHVVQGLLDGYNGTLLAYGQTGRWVEMTGREGGRGDALCISHFSTSFITSLFLPIPLPLLLSLNYSGKTHTMMGRPEFEMDTSFGNISGSHLPPDLPSTPHTPRTGGIGVIPRAMDDLFAMVAEFQDTIEFTFKVSYVEVYCEKVRDLLDTENGGDLKLHDGQVTGATEVFVQSQAEILKVIEAGQLGRMTAATRMNEESSRSHALLLLTVTQKNTETFHIRRGKLTLVDLAGSERIAKTGALGLRLEEAKNINRSLTTLGMVISALADGKSHVPYRDAKLTRILAESLGGNSRTCLIVCCAPELSHSQESISTLRFGERAKKVKNHAVRNEELSAYELQILLTRALAEIGQLKALLLVGGRGGENAGGGVEGGVVAVSDAATTEMATAAAAMANLVAAPNSSAVLPAVEEGEAALFSSPVLAAAEEADGVAPLTDDDTHLATDSSSSALAEAEGGEEASASAVLAQEEGRAALMSTGSISVKRAYTEKDNLLSPMEVELGRLRALLGEKDDENAYLSMRNDELARSLAEEEAAVVRAMEEQSALESRLEEAEASRNQMMRAMAEAGQGSMRSNSIREGGSGGEGAMGGGKTAGSSAPPEEWTEEEGKEGGKGKPTPLLFLSVGVDAPNDSSSSNMASSMSPSLRQVYEEKLLSVERVS